VNNKIIVARHVDIVEKDVKCIDIDSNDYDNDATTDDDLSDNAFESENETKEEKNELKIKDTKNSKLKIPRRSTRESNKISREQF